MKQHGGSFEAIVCVRLQHSRKKNAQGLALLEKKIELPTLPTNICRIGKVKFIVKDYDYDLLNPDNIKVSLFRFIGDASDAQEAFNDLVSAGFECVKNENFGTE